MQNLKRYNISKFLEDKENLKTKEEWEKFQYPGEKGDLCVVCEKQHGEHRRHVHANVVCYTCEDCTEDIEDYIEKEFYEDNANHRLRLYLQEGKFIPEVSGFLVPFDDTEAVYEAEHDEDSRLVNCYFCRKQHILYHEGTTLPVPVDENSNGGNVSCCPACTKVLAETSVAATYFVDDCVLCEKDYSITGRERKARLLNNSMGKHLCGGCFLSLHGELKQERFVPRICVDCEGVHVYDKTLILDLNTIPAEGESLCNTCLSLKNWATILYESYNVPYTMFASVIKQEKQKVKYIIYKCKQEGNIKGAKIVFTSDSVRNTFYATLEILQYFKKNLKTKTIFNA